MSKRHKLTEKAWEEAALDYDAMLEVLEANRQQAGMSFEETNRLVETLQGEIV